MAKRRVVKRQPRTRRRSRKSSDTLPGRAIAGLLKTLTEVSRRSALALNSLESMRNSAAEHREHQLVTAALHDNLLDDLLSLDRALSLGGDTGDPELVRLRAVPAAVLRWAAVHMNLEPVLMVGDTRDIPAGALDKYEWDEATGARPGRLVTVRVLKPGWRWRGKVLKKPKVQITE